MNKGRLFIISGPSGSGKDTLLIELFKKCPDLKFSISSITRDMREGEKQGEKYNFVSREVFENMIANGELLEYNLYLDNYYGTPKAPVENAVNCGDDIVVEVDVNGADKIRKQCRDSISIFIMPPSLEALKCRLCGRGTDSESKIQGRLKCAISEIERAQEYDYIVVNDNLETAVNDIVNIITTDRLRADRNLSLIDRILNF